MSLVQEALKRKAEEQQTKSPEKPASEAPEIPASAGSEPPAPPPPPAPPSVLPATFQRGEEPPPPPKRNALKAGLVWLVILLLLAGLGVAGYYAFATGLLAGKKTKDEAAPAPTATPAPETAQDIEMVNESDLEPKRDHSLAYKLIQKAKDIKAKEIADRETAGEPMTMPLEEPAPPAPPQTPPTATPKKPDPTPTALPAPRNRQTTEKSKPKTTPNEKKSAAPSAASESTDAAAQEVPLAWPKIRLTGVMASKNKSANGLAIIDGQIISCGQRVQGIKLISVHQDGIVLEFQGEIRTLRVGGEMF